MLFTRPIRLLTRRPSLISYFHYTLPSQRKVLQNFKLADIGEGITECEVIKWSVKPQGSIQAFDPLCEVQSDKASVEITSPYDGVVKELLVQEGEIAKVGSGLCIIEVEDEKTSLPEEEESPPPPSDTPKDLPQRRMHPLDPNYAPPPSSSEDILATPSVRYFSRQKGVDLRDLVPGSGKGGRIEKSDVEAYLSRGSEVIREEGEKDVVVELGRTRYGMWKAMVKSLEIPHFGYSTTLDLTSIHNLLPTLNAHIPPHFLPESSTPRQPLPKVNPSALYPAPCTPPVPPSSQYTRLTYLPILLKSLSKAMIQWPLLRSSITTPNSNGKPTLTVRPHADIALALSTPTGLYTPTLQSVDTYSVYDIFSQVNHLSYLGRQEPCMLTPKEMPKKGGTITVSNVGAIGAGEYASPVLVPGGGVAIVAIGRGKWVWDVSGGEGERRFKVGVSWSADHRVVEGAELAAFVECWRGYVEYPERLIAEGV